MVLYLLLKRQIHFLKFTTCSINKVSHVIRIQKFCGFWFNVEKCFFFFSPSLPPFVNSFVTTGFKLQSYCRSQEQLLCYNALMWTCNKIVFYLFFVCICVWLRHYYFDMHLSAVYHCYVLWTFTNLQFVIICSFKRSDSGCVKKIVVVTNLKYIEVFPELCTESNRGAIK